MVLAGASLSACSLEPFPGRPIRGHASLKEDVAHAEPARHADRYCSHCHGATLTGGDHGEPACLTCHGVTWQAAKPSLRYADADHTAERGGYFHNPGLMNPVGTCDACHGAELKGDGDLTPSCYLCHDKVW